MNICRNWVRVAALFGLLSYCATGAAQSTEDERIQEVVRAAELATAACDADIRAFCSDVTPGDGRILACLQAYRDRVSASCDEVLTQWQAPDLLKDFQTTRLYPTLEDRELGEPNLDEEGDRVIWPYRLPFLAQNVIDLGFDLPNPYGLGIIGVRIQQDLELTDLAIGVNGPVDTEIDFVDFGTPSVENNTVQVRADAWVLPFLNVFVTLGKFTGDAEIPLSFEGSELFPAFCTIAPNNPVCVRTYSAIASPSYNGENVALGINLAMGWDRFFVTLPATYAWTNVDIIPQTVTATNVSPRFGMTGDMGERGMVAVFLGASYLDAEVLIADEIVLETPGGPSGDLTSLAFEIRQRNKDKWNYLIGFNWEMNRKFSVMVEAGFGGSRDNFIAGATYRF
jgi:hypothetical protein